MLTETCGPAPSGPCTCPTDTPLLSWERQGPGKLGLQLAQVSGWHHWGLANILLINFTCLQATPWYPGLRWEGGENAVDSFPLPSCPPFRETEMEGLSPAPTAGTPH